MAQRDMTLEEFSGFTDRIVDSDGKVVGIIKGWMKGDLQLEESNITDSDAHNILIQLDEDYDPEIGINWEVIGEAISTYFEEV